MPMLMENWPLADAGAAVRAVEAASALARRNLRNISSPFHSAVVEMSV